MRTCVWIKAGVCVLEYEVIVYRAGCGRYSRVDDQGNVWCLELIRV